MNVQKFLQDQSLKKISIFLKNKVKIEILLPRNREYSFIISNETHFIEIHPLLKKP